MENALIKDYKIRCYNLQNRITPFKADMPAIEKRAKEIRKEKKCDELQSYKFLKKRLENEIMKKAVEKVGK